jgi:hypothetical protein
MPVPVSATSITAESFWRIVRTTTRPRGGVAWSALMIRLR